MNTKLINEIAEKNNVYICLEYTTISNTFDVNIFDKESYKTITSSYCEFKTLIEAMQYIDNFDISDYEVIESTTKTYKKKEQV